MIDEAILEQQVIDKLEKINEADIIVGIPSYNNESTIAHVVDSAAKGMTQHFPDLKPVLINADGGSSDLTRDIVANTPTPKEVDKIITKYKGLPGKGSAFRTIFKIADILNAKICIVVDSDLRSITPEWIKLLGEPIYKHNYGFVAPYYIRYKYDGTITNSIAYPLTRALYGHNIRQPIGGDFGVCWALAKVFSQQNFWEDEKINRFGIDIWMTTTAINEGFRICQASMGAKLHDAKDPGSDLSPMFREVVGTIFDLMKKYEVKWKVNKGSDNVPVFGESQKITPEQFAIDLIRLIENFQKGFKKNKKILQSALQPDTFMNIESLTHPPTNLFYFPNDLWVRVVYEFAVAYNWLNLEKDVLLNALIPLYFGRVASFVLETEVMDSTQAEDQIEATAKTFEYLKPYLIQRWDAAKSTKFF